MEPTSNSSGSGKVMWIIIGIIIVILIVLGLIFMGGKGTDEVVDNSVAGTEESVSEQQSLKDLMARTQTCEFSDSSIAGVTSSGKVFIDAGKIRGDFTTVANGQTSAGHMIVKDNTTYVWMDGQTTGFKMAFDAQANAQAQQSAQQSIDANKKLNYDCDSWNADSSVFNLPSGVTFNSMGTVGAGASADVKVMQCNACNSLSGDQKAQCRAALACAN